eukprot:6613221-Ditylum_brightwellii.AAC.1
MSDDDSIVPETVFETPAPTIHRSSHAAAIKKLYGSDISDSDNEMVMKLPDTVTVTKVVKKTTSKKAAAITLNLTKRKPPISTKDNTQQTRGKKPTYSTTEDTKQSILSAKIALLQTYHEYFSKNMAHYFCFRVYY